MVFRKDRKVGDDAKNLLLTPSVTHGATKHVSSKDAVLDEHGAMSSRPPSQTMVHTLGPLKKQLSTWGEAVPRSVVSGSL